MKGRYPSLPGTIALGPTQRQCQRAFVGPLTAVAALVTKLAKDAGCLTAKAITPHGLRHTSATS